MQSKQMLEIIDSTILKAENGRVIEYAMILFEDQPDLFVIDAPLPGNIHFNYPYGPNQLPNSNGEMVIVRGYIVYTD